MNKLAFIGPKVLAKMLKLQGIDTFAAERETEALSALQIIFKSKVYRVVFITEALAEEVKDLDAYLTNPQINVMIIPDNRGTTGVMQEKINQLIKEAIGGEIKI